MSDQPDAPDTIDQRRFLEIADHTLLAPGTTAAELDAFIDDAVALGVKRVCVSPHLLPVDKRGLEIVTVVGFPSGSHHADIKAAEADRAIDNGADEIDMVVNRSLVREGQWNDVEREVHAVHAACGDRVLKVILETATLTDEQVTEASLASMRGGADFVKTSTGFDPAGGASVHDVRLMAQAVGHALGVKASGGVRTAAAVKELWAAGASRFGVSGTAAIVAGWDDEQPTIDAPSAY